MSLVLIEEPCTGVKRIVLNRPDQLNAFTFEMYEELLAVLQSLRLDTQTRVVILTGAGRGFCAGHDATYGGKAPWVDADVGKIQYGKYAMLQIAAIPVALRSLPQPVIAAVNGAAAGIGYALALASDLCLAADTAKFVNSVHNAGTGAELGLSYLLPRAVGTQRAAELLLTARPVLADEAERIGLVLRSVPAGSLQNEALQLAESIMVNSPIGIWLTKQSLWFNQGIGSLEAAIEMENRAVIVSQATEDTAEKRASFREKRKPEFKNK